MLVYEYVDNGNLDQWLHGDVGEVSPLTWDIRVNIIIGTAKGYDHQNHCDLLQYGIVFHFIYIGILFSVAAWPISMKVWSQRLFTVTLSPATSCSTASGILNCQTLGLPNF